MYNPTRFKSTDIKEAFQLMDENSFATVISVHENIPVISLLPLTPIETSEGLELIGHMARANPHSKVIGLSPVTVIFHGPHTFITPVWYKENNVPTWNYTAVNICGSVEMIEDTQSIIQAVRILSEQMERLWPNGWEFFLPEDLSEEVLPKQIVAFKIKVESLNYKKKLHQAASPEDRAGVLKGLSERPDEGSQRILKEMQKLYLPSGEKR